MISRSPLKEPAHKPTHHELVDVAREWLSRKHPVVVTELANASFECPDAIGFHSQGNTTLIECKASRSDFLADRKKMFRQMPEQGMGLHRYFLAPAGLLSADELPGGWGLLEWNGRHVRSIRASSPFEPRNNNAERTVLVSTLRRLGQRRTEGVSIQCYTVNRYERLTGRPSKKRATLSVIDGHG